VRRNPRSHIAGMSPVMTACPGRLRTCRAPPSYPACSESIGKENAKLRIQNARADLLYASLDGIGSKTAVLRLWASAGRLRRFREGAHRGMQDLGSSAARLTELPLKSRLLREICFDSLYVRSFAPNSVTDVSIECVVQQKRSSSLDRVMRVHVEDSFDDRYFPSAISPFCGFRRAPRGDASACVFFS